MSKFSCARAAVLGVVSNAVPRCTAQANKTCAGVFSTRVAIAETTGSSRGPGLIPWPRRKSQKHDVVLPAEIQKLCFWQIRMRLDLHDGRLDSGGFVDGHQAVQGDVRKADGATFVTVNKALHLSISQITHAIRTAGWRSSRRFANRSLKSENLFVIQRNLVLATDNRIAPFRTVEHSSQSAPKCVLPCFIPSKVSGMQSAAP
jgi:hypothetical protein